MTYAQLINNLINQGILKTPKIIEAFRAINRADFLPENLKDEAGLDNALPIGFGQTISQPYTVAFMLELLQPQAGEKILDVGAGSGWTSALLAHCVGPEGKVIAIERIGELCEFGKKNISRYNFIEKKIVKFICADGSQEVAGEAPFDKIIAAAAGIKAPLAWKAQLKIGGRIVLPLGQSIWLVEKKSEKRFEEKEFPGFVFVPLVSSKQ